MEFKLFWANLPSEAKTQFEKNSVQLQLKRGESIYRQGDLPKGMYFIEEGLVGLVVTGHSGNDHLLRFFKQGQFFGHRSLFSEEAYHASAIALEATTVQMIPKKILLDVLNQFPLLYRDVVQVLAKELRRSEIQRVTILEHEVLSRTALALVYLKELQPDYNWTRQEIANFTASTPSTVIKALAELETMGVIRQEGRNIQILNRDALIGLQDQIEK